MAAVEKISAVRLVGVNYKFAEMSLKLVDIQFFLWKFIFKVLRATRFSLRAQIGSLIVLYAAIHTFIQ